MNASAVAVSASSPAKKFSLVPTGTVIVAVFGMPQPAASSGASGVVTVTGTVIEPPTGIATAPTVPQAIGGPPRQTQGAGKTLRVAAGRNDVGEGDGAKERRGTVVEDLDLVVAGDESGSNLVAIARHARPACPF